MILMTKPNFEKVSGDIWRAVQAAGCGEEEDVIAQALREAYNAGLERPAEIVQGCFSGSLDLAAAIRAEKEKTDD
jgi:hypothetical protein